MVVKKRTLKAAEAEITLLYDKQREAEAVVARAFRVAGDAIKSAEEERARRLAVEEEIDAAARAHMYRGTSRDNLRNAKEKYAKAEREFRAMVYDVKSGKKRGR